MWCDWLNDDIRIVLILVGSFFGGFVNAIAGGGGLVSLPVMLSVFPDAPLPSIFGTTKSAMVWGTAWARGRTRDMFRYRGDVWCQHL